MLSLASELIASMLLFANYHLSIFDPYLGSSMSYQVLARKWRPAKFEHVVGQSHVLHALTNALTQNRLHHAYLFSGTRGVGKTSLARLFAKGLNCEQGVSANPCGVCSSCVEIAQGRFVDLIEVDAASRTKVDDTRELLDNVQYRPSRGRYKVYLIDEVHMLSRSSFNALLKTLEEPPEHVKFLLATTDPQRLPVTVLSRCLQFNLKSLTLDEICQQLVTVLTQETIAYDDGAIKLLAKSANGSMRDALSLTDQAIAFGAGQVQLSQVQTMLGTIDEHYVIVLLKALCDGNIGELIQVTDEVLSFGADPVEVLRSLLELLHQITLTQFAPAAAQLSKYAEQIKAFALQLRPEQVQLYYQLLLTGRKDLPHAPDPKSGLEMALLRAVAFVPDVPIKQWQGASDSQKLVLPTAIIAPASTLTESKSVEVKLQVETQVKTPTETVKLGEGATQPQEVVTDSDDCEDEALLSEQALILSQAESQRPITDSPQVDAKTAVETIAQSNRGSEQVDLQAYVDYQQDYAGQDNDSEQYYHVDDTLSYHAATEPMSPLVENEPQQAETVLTSTAEETSEPELPLGDDLLDAVLAARESLLADLGDDSSKESGAKKSESETTTKAYVPPKRKPVENSVVSSSTEVAATIQAIDVQSDSAQQQSGQVDDYDRPPWEAAPEDSVPVEDLQTVSVTVPVTTDYEQTDVQVVETEANSNRIVQSDIPVSQQAAVLHQPNPAQAQELMPEPLPYSDEITGNDVDLSWYRLMSALEIGGRVRQLAVNSVCQQFVNPLPLVLKPNQKHLEAESAVRQLEEALTKALDGECQVAFSIGIEPDRETPLEIRKRFHQELLAKSQQDLLNDDNIRWLTEVMGAEIDPDTLVYPSELLGQRTQTIELIDKSNFIELDKS